MYQTKYSFDRATLIKIAKGAIIAGGGAITIYMLQAISAMDMGIFTPLAVSLASIAINSIKEYISGN